MILEQYFLGCLSQASYLVGDETTGRAVVVDPQRDVSAYLADAERAGVRIERVIETHFHADFLSGHLELAAATGAVISFGPGAIADFPIDELADGQRLVLGEVELEVRSTPGHTPESICVVVHRRPGEAPYAVLTGDTLFLGDVGRPDLLSAGGMTADELARKLHCSLHEKILTLPDETIVYPGHGAGSACGKQLSTETSSTLGEQRRTNYALAPMSEDDFVAVVTEGQTATPAYFAYDAQRNRQAHPLLDDHEAPSRLALDDVMSLQREGAVILDTRSPADFAAGHLPGSINVGLEGRFAEYAGDVLQPDSPIVLVCEPGHELEARVRLGRIGFDEVVCVLDDPSAAVVVASSRVTASQLADLMTDPDAVTVLDVRNPGEVAEGAVPGSVNIPLARLATGVDDLDGKRPLVVYCAGGYRSSIAASYLAGRGFADVSDLLGGYAAWAALSSSGRTRESTS